MQPLCQKFSVKSDLSEKNSVRSPDKANIVVTTVPGGVKKKKIDQNLVVFVGITFIS